MESWVCGGGPLGWRMNDRGVEAEQERRVVLFHSISSHNVITAAQRKRSPAGMWVGNLCECFPRESKEPKRTYKDVHMWVCPCICVCTCKSMESGLSDCYSCNNVSAHRGNTRSTVLMTFFRPGPLFIFPAKNEAARFTTATLNLHCGTSCLQHQPDAPRQHWPRQILHQFLLNLQNIPLLSSCEGIFFRRQREL